MLVPNKRNHCKAGATVDRSASRRCHSLVANHRRPLVGFIHMLGTGVYLRNGNGFKLCECLYILELCESNSIYMCIYVDD